MWFVHRDVSPPSSHCLRGILVERASEYSPTSSHLLKPAIEDRESHQLVKMPQPRAVLSLIILSTFAATSLAVGTDCFVPNGTDRNEGTDVSPGSVAYVPCDQRAPFSMCCRYGGDDCLPNGLCQGHASDGSEPIWRESCTDPTWTSPYCLKLCLTGKTPSGFDCMYLDDLFQHQHTRARSA